MSISRLGASLVLMGTLNGCEGGQNSTKQVASVDCEVCEDCPEQEAPNTDDTPGGDSGFVDSGEPDTGGGDTAAPDLLEEVPQNETPWNPDASEVSSTLASAYMAEVNAEISGVVFHPDREALLVVNDNGGVAEIGLPYGNLVNQWSITADAEGITVNDEGDVFVANETDNTILNADLDDESTSVACELIDLPKDGGAGFEALTFVPSAHAPDSWGEDPSGFFIAGTQAEANLYVYAATPCADAAELSSVATIAVPYTNTDSNPDVSGLDFNYRGTDGSIGTNALYVLTDDNPTSSGHFTVMKLDGTILASYELPSDVPSPWTQQEGIAIFNVDCGESYDDYQFATAHLAIAEDTGGLYAWKGFPVSCQPEDLLLY